MVELEGPISMLLSSSSLLQENAKIDVNAMVAKNCFDFKSFIIKVFLFVQIPTKLELGRFYILHVIFIKNSWNKYEFV